MLCCSPKANIVPFVGEIFYILLGCRDKFCFGLIMTDVRFLLSRFELIDKFFELINSCPMVRSKFIPHHRSATKELESDLMRQPQPFLNVLEKIQEPLGRRPREPIHVEHDIRI